MSNRTIRSTGISRVAVAVLILAAALPALAEPQLHYWPANGSAVDVAGGAQCTFTNASWTEGLTGGSAFGFGSAGAQVACSNDIGRFGTSDFVISFALKTTQAEHAVAVLSKRGICGHSNFWDIRLMWGLVEAELDDGIGNYTMFVGSRTVADGAWHTVAIVRTGQTTTLYVDGAFDGSFVAPTGMPADLNSDDQVLIGRNVCEPVICFDGYSSGAQFTGAIDEVMISSK